MTARKHIYLLLDVVREEPAGSDLAAYKPEHEPQNGYVHIRDQRLPDGEHFVIQDGPITWYAQPGYLGSYGVNDDGDALVPTPQTRIIELVNAGYEMEATLRAQLHTAFDMVREYVDEALDGDKRKEGIMKKMDDIEKQLM